MNDIDSLINRIDQEIAAEVGRQKAAWTDLVPFPVDKFRAGIGLLAKDLWRWPAICTKVPTW
jgi:hypothetical protein